MVFCGRGIQRGFLFGQVFLEPGLDKRGFLAGPQALRLAGRKCTQEIFVVDAVLFLAFFEGGGAIAWSFR